jgi:hypothetical protein
MRQSARFSIFSSTETPSHLKIDRDIAHVIKSYLLIYLT